MLRRPRELVSRVWAAPLPAHVAALAVVLLALVPVINSHVSFSADEGAAIAQARTLSRSHQWILAHPAPELDPRGEMYPLELSDRGRKGIAPFVGHPLYALALAGADRVAGVTAMVLLSVFGTIAAAAAGARLAARFGAGLAKPTLWTLGIASPLLFDGYLVIAHTLGAAAAGAATLGALAFAERRNWIGLGVALESTAVAVLLRNEAAIFAASLAVVVVVVGWRRLRWVGVIAGGAIAGVAAAAHIAEGAWRTHIVGAGGLSTRLPVATGSRFDGFVNTWLSPGLDAGRTAETVLIMMLVVTVFAAVQLRRQHPTAIVFAIAAALLTVARLAVAPPDIVPGLVVAFPLLVIGLVCATRLEPLGAIAALFAMGVLVTQYDRGGTTEWGGRYFALGLPIAVPVVLAGAYAAYERFSVPRRRLVPAALVVQALALAVLAIGSLRAGHQTTDDLIAAAERAPSTPRPVMLTSFGAVPRLSWRLLDRQRWLLARDVDVAMLSSRLRAAGIDEVTVVDRASRDELRQLPGYREVRNVDTGRATGWRVTVLRAS